MLCLGYSMLMFYLGLCLQSLRRQLGDRLVEEIMLDVTTDEVLHFVTSALLSLEMWHFDVRVSNH